MKRSDQKTIFKGIGLMEGRMGIYAVSIFLMAFVYGIVMDVYVSIVYKDLLDAAFAFDVVLMKKYGMILVAIVLSACIVCPLLSYITHYCIQRTLTEVRIKLFKKVVRLSIPYYQKSHSRQIISCVNGDIYLLELLYFWPIFRLLLVTLIGGGSIIALLYFSKAVAVTCIVIAGITLVINTYYANKIGVYAKKVQELIAKLTGITMDDLNSFHVSRIYNIRSFLRKKYEDYNAAHYLNKIKLSQKEGELAGINNLLNYLGYILICMICLYLMGKHQMTVGETVACISLRGGVEFFVSEIGSILEQLQFATAGTERVFRILEEDEEKEFEQIAQNNSYVPMDDEIVSFKNVGFSYDEGKKSILEHIDFAIAKGKRTAIIGESGSGKSTLTKLLLGFYEMTEGEIYYKGQPISQYTKEQIRNEIAYVPQEPTLFNDTIKHNIGLDVEDDEAIIAAAKNACIHDFIMSLPDQYNTMVGENGARLSGGQKQRLAIARAFLKPASIIVFDEATSAVEQELETKIMDAIQAISKDRTIIFITHRLQILRIMNQVIKIDNHKAIDVTEEMLTSEEAKIGTYA